MIRLTRALEYIQPVARLVRRIGQIASPALRFSRHDLAVQDDGNPERGEIASRVGACRPINLLPKRGTYPSGWVTITGVLEGPTGSQVCHLGLATDAGVSTKKPIRLGRGIPLAIRTLLFLPEGVRRLWIEMPTDATAGALRYLTAREIGKLQLGLFSVSNVWRRSGTNPRRIVEHIWKAVALLRMGDVRELSWHLSSTSVVPEYEEWLENFDTLTHADVVRVRDHIRKLAHKPLISVIMPVYNPEPRFLRRAIESVRAQYYPEWELCIADDGSSKPQVKRVLDEYAAQDERIRVVFRKENGHISAASNSALLLAGGEYDTFLDHDDELAPHALYMSVAELKRHPDAGLIYSDEDKLDAHNRRHTPHFKSSWNPELLRAQNCICHLAVYRADLVREVGGLREGYEGAQDWDLALRITERLTDDQIIHIPHILYHWRTGAASTSGRPGAKPYALEAGGRAIEDHLARTGIQGTVEILSRIASCRVRRSLPSPVPLVSIIILTRDNAHLLEQCIRSIRERTTFEPYELVIVDNGTTEPAAVSYLGALSALNHIRVLHDDRTFNFSALTNEAVRHSDGELVAFLNNDTEVINGGWLTEMVSQACAESVGAVGARLWYPNGRLQHGGVITGIRGVAGHAHKWLRKARPGYLNRAALVQNVSAVTAACMIVPRHVHEEVGGFNEQDLTIAFNDVDYCLRIGECGYRIVWTPFAELYHHESTSRGYETTPDRVARFEREKRYLQDKWGKRLLEDPYYNPNLTLESEDFALAAETRAIKPWQEQAEGCRQSSTAAMANGSSP